MKGEMLDGGFAGGLLYDCFEDRFAVGVLSETAVDAEYFHETLRGQLCCLIGISFVLS